MRLVAVARPASKAKAKRSEAKGGNLTADGWPWLYSTQPALGPAQRVNVERSLTPRLASLLYTWAPDSTPRHPSLLLSIRGSHPFAGEHRVYERAARVSWYFDAWCALWPPRFDFLPICNHFYFEARIQLHQIAKSSRLTSLYLHLLVATVLIFLFIFF